MEKLKSVEASRLVLVTQLREALQEQESKLENIRTQMQVAQAQTEEANNMRKRLNDENYTAAPSTHGNAQAEQKSKRTAADIAAEVVDKLTASSSSQLIMTSVLSTFAAEEAKNAGLANTSSNSYPAVPVSPAPNAMPKLEQPTSISDANGFVPVQPALTAPTHQYQSMLMTQPTLQSPSPVAQSQYQLLPNTTEQYAQTSRGVTTYGCGSLPPLPPPLPPHVMGPMMPLAQTQLQMNQQSVPMMQQSAPLTQQQLMLLMQPPPGNQSFRPLQPPGMLYFSQSHHLQ